MVSGTRGYVAKGECRASNSCYIMGCRNACCVEAHTRYTKRNRALKLSLGLIQHGPVGYDCGCRCADCLPSRAARYKAETLRTLANSGPGRVNANDQQRSIS